MVEVDGVENLEFKWGKKKGIGGKKKDIQFYGSFTYDGVEYTLYDCVYLYNAEEVEPYIGKLIKIWETPDHAKKVKVLWFFRPSEISNFLGNVQTSEKELFLACGEGVGLTNINSLEAISGKCNVLCTSKDDRNPQPSDEQLQISDFIFYRTFDVGQRKVMDKINENIAGIEVKFIFNRVGQSPSGALKFDSDKKEVGKNATESDGTAIAQLNIPEIITAKRDGGFVDAPVKVCGEQKSLPVDNVDVESGGKARVGEGPKEDSLNCTNFRSKAKENEHTNVPLIKQNAVDKQKNISINNTGMSSKVEERADSKALLVGKKSTNGEKVTSRAGAQMGDTVRKFKPANVHSDKIASSSKVEFDKRKAKGNKVLEVKEDVKSLKDPGELDNRPSKKEKLDSSMKVFDDKIKNGVQSSGHGASIDNEDKSKTKRAIVKDSLVKERGPFKKPKLDEAHMKPPIGKLVEVTRRPNLDKDKWFKDLPWEERIRTAHEQGTLVLLENLDPSYTSIEVEDIVWHAFNEACSAKMIQRIAFSSPHSGQAYVIFKTRETAEMVVSKLDEGCLLLSNGRPLIGSIRTPCFMGKQSTFVGHLAIEKLKYQMQRETREAVSTSHCSQPNTLEYDMAIDWCLQQERVDRAWKKLYEVQGLELKKLKAKFKSN